jgi:hypothetical protein
MERLIRSFSWRGRPRRDHSAQVGLVPNMAAAGAILDWAKGKGYAPEVLARAIEAQGIGPIANEMAEDVTRVAASVRKPGIVMAENIPALYDLALSDKTNQKIEIRYKTVDSDEAAKLHEVTGNNLEGYIHSMMDHLCGQVHADISLACAIGKSYDFTGCEVVFSGGIPKRGI